MTDSQDRRRFTTPFQGVPPQVFAGMTDSQDRRRFTTPFQGVPPQRLDGLSYFIVR
jgi:hypothetical protein